MIPRKAKKHPLAKQAAEGANTTPKPLEDLKRQQVKQSEQATGEQATAHDSELHIIRLGSI